MKATKKRNFVILYFYISTNSFVRIYNLILITSFLFLVTAPTMGQEGQLMNESERLLLDPSVRYGKLENGFTYYLRNNDVPKGKVHFQMVVKAGKFHEDSLQVEYAHLLEHLGASRTRHFQELSKYIKYHGGYNNAGTDDLFTSYWLELSTKNRELLKNSLQIIRDWAQDIDIDQRSIDVERGAVLGETRTSNPYREWYHGAARRMVEHNSGYRSKDKNAVIGNLRNFNREAFDRYYKEWYRPDLEAAIIIGDINVDSLETEIKKMFADLKAPKKPKDPSLSIFDYAIQLDGKNKFNTQVDTVSPYPRLRIFSKTHNPGYDPKTRADFRNLLIQKVYEKLLLTRMDAINQYKPLFAVTSNNQYANHQLYTLQISIIFKENEPLMMKQKFLKSIVEFRSINSGFTDEELRKAKEIIRKNTYQYNKLENTNELAEKYRNHFVLGTAALAPEQEKQMVNDLIDQINLKDIHEASAHYGDLTENTDFLYSTRSDTISLNSIIIQGWLKESYSMEVKPYFSKPVITSLCPVVKTSANDIKAVKSISENQIGVTTVELSNGIKLMLKPTGSFNHIRMRASRPNNVPIQNKKEYITATLAPRAMQFTGAGTYTKFQIEEFRGGVDLQMNQKLELTEQVILGSSTVDRVEDLLQLLWLYTQEPRLDEEAFKEWKDKELRLIERGNPDKNMFFNSAIEKLRFPELPRPNAQFYDSLTMDEIYTSYRRWYRTFGGYTFVFTGGFDTNELLLILIKYLSALPEGNHSDTKTSKTPIVPLRKISEIKHLNNISASNVFLQFPVIASTDTKTKVLVDLLGNALYSRIWDRLRKGSYSPGARADLVDFNNGVYNIQIWFDAETGEEQTLTQWALEEFRKLKEDGVNEDWFKKNLNLRISNYDMRFSNSRFWNNYLSERVRSGQSMTAEIIEYGTFLKHFVTLKDLNEVAKELLNERYLQEFIFLPNDISTTSGF